MTTATRFRKALSEADREPLLAPVVFDALSAQLVARAGFRAAWLGGSGITNALLGMPDAGYVNLTDVDYVLKRAASATPIPLLVDLDDGFGSFLNVIQSIRTVETSGAAGGQIDDQLSHRTPYGGTTLVVPANEVIGKIKAAVDSRHDADFFVVARTDAFWSEGLDSAIERINQYAEAGADAGFITGVFTPEALEKVVRETQIPHRMLSGIPNDLPLGDIRALGFDIVALGQGDLLRASVLGMWKYLENLRDNGVTACQLFREEVKDTIVGDWAEFTGMKALSELEKKYLRSEELDRRYRFVKE